MDEYENELGDRSDADLLKMVQEFGADKALDIAAEETRENILAFINSINHERRDNRIAVKVSDLMVNDDFANYGIPFSIDILS